MLWMSKPPYLRWFAAGAVILAAFVWDLSNRATTPYPFAATDLVRGSLISGEAIEWRDAPTGVFAIPDLNQATASVDIAEGDPITRSVLGSSISIPQGWWSVPIALPPATTSGVTIRVVLPNGDSVSGIVMQAATSDNFGALGTATVAFPSGAAELVAQMAALGELVILIEP